MFKIALVVNKNPSTSRKQKKTPYIRTEKKSKVNIFHAIVPPNSPSPRSNSTSTHHPLYLPPTPLQLRLPPRLCTLQHPLSPRSLHNISLNLQLSSHKQLLRGRLPINQCLKVIVRE